MGEKYCGKVKVIGTEIFFFFVLIFSKSITLVIGKIFMSFDRFFIDLFIHVIFICI